MYFQIYIILFQQEISKNALPTGNFSKIYFINYFLINYKLGSEQLKTGRFVQDKGQTYFESAVEVKYFVLNLQFKSLKS